MTQLENKRKLENDDIDVIALINKILLKRKVVYYSLLVFLILGLLIGFGTPNTYKSESKLLVESNSKSGGISGTLQQLSGLAGINLKSTEDALIPELYPEVVKNIPFLLEVLDQKITESRYDSTLTVGDYLERFPRSTLLSKIKDYTIGLPVKLFSLFKGSHSPESPQKGPSGNTFYISAKQTSLIGILSQCIRAEMGTSKLSNVLIITAETQDPLVSAELNSIVVKCLQKYIISYRTQKAQADLEFVMERHKEAEKKYVKTQELLANYRDQNRNIITASSRNQEERLLSEFNLSYGIYNSLSQQLEQSKIEVQENTPVFKILNPATIPLVRNRPQTKLILIGMILAGSIFGFGLIFLMDFLKNIKNGIKS